MSFERENFLINGASQYSSDLLCNVPSVPGIYAWYGKLMLGHGDIKRDISEDGEDRGVERVIEALLRHTVLFKEPDLSISVNHRFDCGWQGVLKTKIETTIREGLSDRSTFSLRADVKKALVQEKNRAMLAQILKRSYPVFSSPLYIGMSKNLNHRLNQHFRLVQKLWEFDSSERLDRIEEIIAARDTNDNEFAARAVKAGFAPEMLEAWVMPIDEIAPTQAIDLIKIAEFVLNRWHRPLLGRL